MGLESSLERLENISHNERITQRADPLDLVEKGCFISVCTMKNTYIQHSLHETTQSTTLNLDSSTPQLHGHLIVNPALPK